MLLNYFGHVAKLIPLAFTDECVDFPAANLKCRMRKAQIFSHDVYFGNESIDAEIKKMLERKEKESDEM